MLSDRKFTKIASNYLIFLWEKTLKRDRKEIEKTLFVIAPGFSLVCPVSEQVSAWVSGNLLRFSLKSDMFGRFS